MSPKPQTDAEWDALEDAIATVYGLRAGHTLTQADVDAISLYDANARASEEGLTDTFHSGYQRGLLAGGGADVQALHNKLDEKLAELSVAKALGKFDHERGFREGLQAMREMLARFVEQGGDATTAASLRANWNPSWGPDPGPPRNMRDHGWPGPQLHDRVNPPSSEAPPLGCAGEAELSTLPGTNPKPTGREA